MLVYFVTDEPSKLPAVRAMFEPQHAVVPWVLDGDGTGVRAHGVLMVDVDLRQLPRADQLRPRRPRPAAGQPQRAREGHYRVLPRSPASGRNRTCHTPNTGPSRWM